VLELSVRTDAMNQCPSISRQCL